MNVAPVIAVIVAVNAILWMLLVVSVAKKNDDPWHIALTAWVSIVTFFSLFEILLVWGIMELAK